ncbi:histidinol dehydrogenase [Chloroflexota bacterium]
MISYLKHAVPKKVEDTKKVQETVREILQRVKEEGEEGVRYYSRKFDDWDPKSFRVTENERKEAINKIPQSQIEDINFCQDQIRRFASEQMDHLNELNFEVETLAGVHLGSKVLTIESSGAYIPGGLYPLLASSHMTIIPPKVAGVKRVVAFSPPVKGQGIWPGTLYAMIAAGADEIYCIGGVQALAAAAYGMAELEPVDIIVGAGNKYIAEAKKQLYGTVGIDLIAGPSEVLIIADHTADPFIIAADILAQAEHDPNTRQALVSLSRKIAEDTLIEIDKQLVTLPTKDVASKGWQNGGEVSIVESPEEAVAFSNRWAPEHLQIQTETYDYYLEHCNNYGSLFLGEETTVAYGDKTIGTNHVLPTMRAARYTGGLSVMVFAKLVTYQYMTKNASIKIGKVCERACKYENMLGHGISCRVRVDKYSNQ